MANRILTLHQLEKVGAWSGLQTEFKRRWGNSVEITPELCESVAKLFDFHWLAFHLLSKSAYANYIRSTEQAWDECERALARNFANAYNNQKGD